VTLAYQQLLATDFADRVNALADEIDAARPHLIGLQEMTKFYIQSPGDMVEGGEVPATNKFLDFFELLLAALEARDADYQVAVMIQNANIELPMVSGGNPTSGYTFDDVRIEDHDVILARDDVVLSDPVSVHYDSFLVVDPDLGLFIPRGYVAVTASINQKTVRFVNTHTEASPPASLRLAQATQLFEAFDDETLPLIIVGDFNTQAPSGLSYQYIIGQGYTDTWLENTISYSFNANGNTFGNNSSLNNTDFNMFERIDFIFVGPQGSPDFDNVIVVGDELGDRTSSGLWPSDHAGIVTKVIYQPDLGKVIANK
jgi:endonuclease/exonuclease/phosphatase family metal-dependent hydrolase